MNYNIQIQLLFRNSFVFISNLDLRQRRYLRVIKFNFNIFLFYLHIY